MEAGKVFHRMKTVPKSVRPKNKRTNGKCVDILGGGFQIFFYVHPYLGE